MELEGVELEGYEIRGGQSKREEVGGDGFRGGRIREGTELERGV